MSFHPDIISRETFVPHSYEALEAVRAFRPEQLPEPAYEKMVNTYKQIDDVIVERITYMHDGLKITGITAVPNNAAANSCDLVIYNRGGSGNYGILTVHTVLRQFVPLVRAGYVVTGSNYRGNDGSDGRDEFGGHDVDDVIALHNMMQQHPAVNDKPCFLIGASRGGMMTYLLIKHKLPVRAAVTIAAVSNQLNWESFRPEMHENVYKRFIPDFEKNEKEALRKRSAICWPEALNVPLLLLHGTSDSAVQHSQSEALAAVLKALNYPHELVLYEGGNHALTRDWADVSKRILDWLGTYG